MLLGKSPLWLGFKAIFCPHPSTERWQKSSQSPKSGREAETSTGCHFRRLNFFGWNWVFTCLIQTTTATNLQELFCTEDRKNGFLLGTETWVKKHANTWRTTRLLSVGGKVLCYKYCRTPLSFKRKTCFAFQTTEMAGQVFSSCARNWKQCERFSLNGDRAWPGLTLKFKPRSELAFHVLFLRCYMQGSPARDRGIIHFFPVILRCVCTGHDSASDLSAFTFGYSEPPSGGIWLWVFSVAFLWLLFKVFKAV